MAEQQKCQPSAVALEAAALRFARQLVEEDPGCAKHQLILADMLMRAAQSGCQADTAAAAGASRTALAAARATKGESNVPAVALWVGGGSIPYER